MQNQNGCFTPLNARSAITATGDNGTAAATENPSVPGFFEPGHSTNRTPDRQNKVSLAVIILASLMIVSCGGGGEDSTASQNDPVETPLSDDGDAGEIDSNEGEAGDNNSNDSTDGNPSSQDDGQDPETSDNTANQDDTTTAIDDETEPTDTEETVDPENTDSLTGSVLQSGAVARVLIRDGMPAVGVDGGTVLSAESIAIAHGGALAFKSRVTTPLLTPGFAQEHLFAGPLNAVQSVLARETEIQGIRAGFEFRSSSSHSVASNGTIAAIANVYREDPNDSIFGTDRSGAIIIADATGAKTEVMLNDKVSSPRGEVTLNVLTSVTVSNAGMAFVGRTTGAGSPFGLFVADDDGYKSVVEDGNGAGRDIAASIGGCRVQLARRQQQTAVMLDSGALIFNATIDGGHVDSPCDRSGSAVIRYENDELKVLVREGDAVPGSENFVFGSIALLSVMNDGSIVVQSVVVDTAGSFRLADHTFRNTYWLVDPSGTVKLIMSEGETINRSDGEAILNFGNVDTGVNSKYTATLSSRPGGGYAVSLYERGFQPSLERFSIHTGVADAAQPHESLHSPGTSALKFSDEIYINAEFTGSQIADKPGSSNIATGFAAADRFLRIGSVAVDSQNNLYFHARVVDSGTATQKGDYVFKRDSTGQLSVLISPLDRIRTEGRDQLLISAVLSNDFGLSTNDTGFSIVVMDDDSLILQSESTVHIQFPQ